MDLGILSALLVFILIVLLGLGTPIAFCLGFLGVVGIAGMVDSAALYQIAEIAAQSGTNLFMLTLPLFILMAEVVSFSGVGDDIYTATNDWLSWLPGGLGMAGVIACGLFGAISGSTVATVVALGGFMIPALLENGYDEKFTLGLMTISMRRERGPHRSPGVAPGGLRASSRPATAPQATAPQATASQATAPATVGPMESRPGAVAELPAPPAHH